MDADETLNDETGAPNTGGTDYAWLGCSALVIAVAAFLRFFWLGLKPFHHDEGVNGFFLTNLLRDGIYKYDPANYHGPTLYYIALPFAQLFGLETVPMRWTVAIFGLLTVVLALFLRRYIGRVGSLFAALFLALSPGMVYISRYFIHEMFFVFLSLGVVVATLFFIEKRRAGWCAIVWMVVLLGVCFLPSGLNLAAYMGGTNTSSLWAFRIAFFIVEGVLVYLVMRMLLTWDEGRPIYLLLAVASVALMFATKETAFITLGTMGIACVCVRVWRSVRSAEVLEKGWFRVLLAGHIVLFAAALYFRGQLMGAAKWLYDNFMGPARPPEAFVFYSIVFLIVTAAATWVTFALTIRHSNESRLTEPVDITWVAFRQPLGVRADLVLLIAASATVFIYITVLFFSSFFTYADGVAKAFEAYAIWTKTGSKDHTQNGIFAYVKWGVKVESAVLILSAVGALVAMFKAKHRFAMFAALWAFGLFAAYTIIPYKTPWLALSYLLPMCIIAGYGINELVRARNIALKVAGVVLAISGSAVLAYQSYDLNFVRYDDEEMGYVYAHTKRGFLDLVRNIERYAEKSEKGKDATIEIVSPDYWPMTWYLNYYEHANFHGAIVDANTAEMIVAKKDDQDAAVIQKYSAHYRLAGVYPLRPGVELMLLVKKDLADRDSQELYKILDK